MRTTLDIEEDVLLAVKELARRENTTAGKVVSRLIRKELAGDAKRPRKLEYKNGIPLLPRRGVIVTNEMIDKIREEEGI
ncbi:MAG TPA: hypothetical protein PLK77_16875 [Pyrinomonadaceae bacterium]|nr:hypothetical protein [Pyrinomonadaceae bacterium]